MSPSSEPSELSRFVAEARRRHVVRFALGYAAAAFVVLQLAEIVFPAFGIGEGGLRLTVALAGLGFPPALVLAWVYDVTKDGITRTEDQVVSPLLQRIALTALLVATVVMTSGLGVYLARQGVFETATVESGVEAVELVAYDPDAPITALAVLPLENNSPSADQAYVTASMHEELIAKLSRLEEIRIVSRTTAMRYADTKLTMPQIGRELGVDVVIEGSVVSTPERIRVTLQVIHAPSDSHITTLQWEREVVSDILAFQSEIAHDVVREIVSQYDATMFADAGSEIEPAAQDAYFRGRFEYERGTADGYRRALAHFGDALSEDPDFAAAMAGRAGARFLMGLESEEVSADLLAEAHGDAETALALDSTSMEAKEVLALIERSVPWLTGGDPFHPSPEGTASRRVVRLPGEDDSIEIDVSAFDTAWVAPLTTLAERMDEQVRRRTPEGGQQEPDDRRAREARQLVMRGSYGRASEVLEEIVRDTPDAASAWDMLARSHIAMGQPDEAVAAVRAWHETGTAQAPTTDDIRDLEIAVDVAGSRGYWNWTLARLRQSAESGVPVPSMPVASAHAALGNDEEALDHLAAALRAGEPGVMTVRSDPVWDGLRRDPRLQEITRQAQSIRLSSSRRSPDRGGA